MEHAGRRGRRRGARAPACHAAAEHVGAPFPHDVHVTFGRVHVAGRDVRPAERANEIAVPKEELPAPVPLRDLRHRQDGLSPAERKPGHRVLGGHGPREPEAVAESRSGLGVGLQPGPAAGGSEPGGVHADEHPRREVTVETDGDLLAIPPLEQLLEHGELLRCGGDVDGLTALFLGPLGGPLLLDVLLRLPLLALLATLVLRVHGVSLQLWVGSIMPQGAYSGAMTGWIWWTLGVTLAVAAA